MKDNELRVGNLLNHKTDGVIVVNAGVIACVDTDFMYEPIPLTEEWLDKFGINGYFIKNIGEKGNICYNYGCFYIYSGMGDCDSYGFKIKFDYVHQLQNWWYWNTNEELTIND